MEYCKNEKGKKKGKHGTSTNHPHKNKKRRGGLKKKDEEWFAESPSLTAWKPLCSAMLPVPLWNRPEERTEGLGNGVAMATKRSTRDVKAQRGLGRGQRGERRGKSLCASAATVFSDEMRTWRNGKEQGSLAAAIST